MSKLKGIRLENEVDKCRAESNWRRLDDLLIYCRAKNSGMEPLVPFLTGECILEKYIEQQSSLSDGVLLPSKSHLPHLSDSCTQLHRVIALSADESSLIRPYVVLETRLLLAKLNYVCADFTAAVAEIAASKLDREEVQFQTLRTLRLVAEAYAIKGLSLEHSPTSGRSSAVPIDTQILNCFEKAAELALAYIQELEKLAADFSFSVPSQGGAGSSAGTPLQSGAAGGQVGQGSATPLSAGLATQQKNTEKIGEFLETAIQRVPLMQLKSTSQLSGRMLEKGIEHYRRVLTAIGDKSVAQHLHQMLSRQLAEVLLRGVPDGCYAPAKFSQAASQKAKSLRFYMGSDRYYTPESRLEEVLLILSISEALAARDAVLSRAPDDRRIRAASLKSVTTVHDLLTLVLSSLRQHQLLAGLFEKAIKFAYDDHYLWYQFALALISYGKHTRAALVLRECIGSLPTSADSDVDGAAPTADAGGTGSQDPVQLMFAARIAIEQLGRYDEGVAYARGALQLCATSGRTWLTGRATLLVGLALSRQASEAATFKHRGSLQREAVVTLEEACRLDVDDHLSHFFLALQCAIGRDLSSARRLCDKSLQLNAEQPYALVLLALLLTAENCYADALELVRDALEDFPSHYGLLVLRLKLEIYFGLGAEALATARDLLVFWRKRSITSAGEEYAPMGSCAGAEQPIRSSQSPPTLPYDIRTNMAATPMGEQSTLTANIAGMRSTSSLLLHQPLAQSASTIGLDATDRESTLAGAGAMSEYAVASTMSDSAALNAHGTDASYKSIYQRFCAQANIWLELAELFLEAGRLSDVAQCVDEAVSLFPASHHGLYLKGRLMLCRMLQGRNVQSATPLQAKGLNEEPLDADQVALTLSEAHGCFFGALALKPSDAASLRQLAFVYQLRKNHAMAEKVLRDLARLDPLAHETWHRMGRVLAEQNRFDEATECLATAAKLESSAPLMPFEAIPRLVHMC